MRPFLAALLVMGAASVPAHALEQDYVVSLVEMPVAVARVAEVPSVEEALLSELLEELFDAELPPAEFIDIVRYAPVLLIEDRDPEIDVVERIRFHEADGLAGIALAQALRSDLRTWGIPVEPRVQLVQVRSDDFFPDIVVDRVGYDTLRYDYDRDHPHGGPPGQIKKDLGLQTGAEVVHGEHPGNRGTERAPLAVIDRDRETRDARVESIDRDDRPRNANRGNSSHANRGNAGNRGNDASVAQENRGRGNSGSGPGNSGNRGNAGNKGKGKGGGR